MNGTTRQVALAAATSLATAGVLVPQAYAAPTKVNAGRTTLTLTAKGKKVLKRNHVKLVARKPGSTKGRVSRLPVKTGKYDFATNRGTVTQGGSLRLKHGRHVVKITGLKVTLGRKSSKVTAKVGARKMTLAVLARGKQTVKSSSANRSVNRIGFRVTARAAKRLDKKLGGRAFKGRGSLGRLSVRVRKPSSTGVATSTPATPPTPDNASAVAKIGIAPGVAQAMAGAGLAPSALPGAELLPDGTFSLPVSAVDIDPQTGTGTVDLTGGFVLGDGENAVTIDKPQIVLDGDDSGLYAAVTGVRVKLANLDSSGVAEAIKGGSTQLSDLLLSLSPEGAAALNQAGGVSLFVPGTPFGDVSVTV